MEPSLLNRYAMLATECDISLAIGQFMCGAPKEVTEAVQSVLNNPPHNRYLPPGGSPEAKKAVAEVYAQMGLEVRPEQCMIGNGAKSLFEVSLHALTESGDYVIHFSPGYPPYWRAAKLLERTAIGVELDDSLAPDLDQLEIVIKSARAEGRGCVLVVCNPSNPTGVAWGRETLEAISSVIKRFEVMVIADETYGDFVYDGLEFVPFARVHGTDDTITIGSASKAFGVPSYRAGYGMGPKEVIERMISATGDMHGCPNSFADSVATVLPRRQPFVEEQQGHLVANRQVVLDWLEKHGYKHAPMDGGFFAWVLLDTPEGMSGCKFATLLRGRGVGIIPGEAFTP